MGFYQFAVHSDSFSFTLANQRWFERYWQPRNALGYRDVDYPLNSLSNKKVMFVVGDSFVAGQGIQDYKNRFSNLLQEKMGSNWVVFNIAQVGWSTTEEYQAITAYPHKPNVIILSYFIDDIRGAANRSHLKEKFPRADELITPPPAYLDSLLKYSYFFNYFYWEWYRYRNQAPEAIYWKRLQYFYDDSEAWQLHKQELENLVNYTRSQQAVLVPLIFPNLLSAELSKPITRKVADLFKSLGAQPIDLTSYFSQKSPTTLVVSRVDAHPNETVNAEVAEILFQAVATLNK